MCLISSFNENFTQNVKVQQLFKRWLYLEQQRCLLQKTAALMLTHNSHSVSTAEVFALVRSPRFSTPVAHAPRSAVLKLTRTGSRRRI